MKNQIFLSLFFLIFFITNTKAQCDEWALFGGTTNPGVTVGAYGVSADNDGNVYAVGTIDSSYGTFNNTTFSNSVLWNGNILFVSKIDSTGNTIWANNIEVDVYGAPHAIQHSGDDLYLLTTVNGNTIIDGQLITNTEQSILIIKFDENGTVEWFKNYALEATPTQTVLRTWAPGIAVDNNGDLVVTGYFSGKLTFGNTILQADLILGQRELFVLKLDEDGDELWGIQSSGNASANYIYNRGWSINTDNSNNILVGGFYYGELTIDTVTVSEPISSFTPYLAKIDGVTGNIIWIRNAVSTGNSGFGNFYGITTDNNDNVIAVGSSDVDITIGGVTLNTGASKPILIVKYDKNGNLIFAKNYGNDENIGLQWGTNVETDFANNIYFSGNGVVGTTLDNYIMEKGGTFLATLDSLGNTKDFKYIGSNGSAVSYAGAFDGISSVYISGMVQDTDTLFHSDNNSLIPTYSNGSYLWKACVESSFITSIQETRPINQQLTFQVVPNLNQGQFQIQLDTESNQTIAIHILDEMGRLVHKQVNTISSGTHVIPFQLNELAVGIYFIQIASNDGSVGARRFIKF